MIRIFPLTWVGADRKDPTAPEGGRSRCQRRGGGGGGFEENAVGGGVRWRAIDRGLRCTGVSHVSEATQARWFPCGVAR